MPGTVKGVERLQPNLDYAQTLKPLEGEVRPTFKKIDKQLIKSNLYRRSFKFRKY